MDYKLLNSLLERSRDRYDMVLRWSSVTVGVFLAFHLFIFIPFLKVDKKLADVEARLIELQNVQKTVEGLSNDLAKLSNMAAERLKKQSNVLYINLRNSFDKLSEAVKNIRSEKGLYEIQSSRDTETPESIQSLQAINEGYIQEVQNKTTTSMFSFNENLTDQIRSAKSIDELREILLPIIEKEIIATQFKTFNQAWQTEILPDMKSFSSEIRKHLEKAESQDKSESAPWGSILAALENTMKYAEEIKFSPPRDRFWWITTKGKEETLSDINFGFSREISQMVSIKEISDNLYNTITEQQDAETKLKNDLERMKNSFDKFLEQQPGQMIGLPKQFGGIPIDLNSLVLCFPFLIGPMLASLAVWQTRRLSDLINAIDMAKKHDESNPLADWMAKKILITRNKRLLSFIGLNATSWLWIGVSFWELSDWHTFTLSIVFLFLLSGGVMTGGFIYRWRVIEHMLSSIIR